MTLSGNISTISTSLDDIYDAIVAKGVTPSGNITTYATAIGQIGGSSPVINSLNVTPTTSAQTITASGGVDGYSPINVSAVTSAIDANIVAGNIKSGVNILGVTGSYTGGGGGGQTGAIYATSTSYQFGIKKEFFFDLTGVTVSTDLVSGSSYTGYCGDLNRPVAITMPNGIYGNDALSIRSITLSTSSNCSIELINGSNTIVSKIADMTYYWDWGTSSGTLTYTLSRPLNNWATSG